MTDALVGYALLGGVALLVLALVFALTTRTSGRPAAAAKPPRGVHMPPPSALPVIMSVGGALLGAGFAFRADGQLANYFLAVPGLLVLLYGIWAWVRAAGREWRETEHAPHDDGHGGH
jgi:hypothetical protein